MYVSGPYREWADFLHDQKCGGRPEPEPLTFTIGTTYDLYWCGNFEETRTVTPENKAWFERVFNDPENDVWNFEKKEGGTSKPGKSPSTPDDSVASSSATATVQGRASSSCSIRPLRDERHANAGNPGEKCSQ